MIEDLGTDTTSSSNSSVYGSGPVRPAANQNPAPRAETNQRPARPSSGEYDRNLIPQVDNGVYGSHDPPRLRNDDVTDGVVTSSATKFPGYGVPAKVREPNDYLYNGKRLDPSRERELHFKWEVNRSPQRRDHDNFFVRKGKKKRHDPRDVDLGPHGRPFPEPPAYRTLFHGPRRPDPQFRRDLYPPHTGTLQTRGGPQARGPEGPTDPRQRFQSRRVGLPGDYDYNERTVRPGAERERSEGRIPPPPAVGDPRRGRRHPMEIRL